MSPHPALSAHLDEASVRLPAGDRIYGLAATLTTVEHHPTISTTLQRLLLSGRSFLHHYDEPERRRIMIVEALTESPSTARSPSPRRPATASKSAPARSYSPSCCPACNTQKTSITS